MKIGGGGGLFRKGFFGLIGWRKTLGQARIRRGKPYTLVGLKHDNLKPSVSGIPNCVYDVEGI